jgi:hypothetical protein
VRASKLTRRLLTLALSAAVFAGFAGDARASCNKPRVMIVLDKSSSMVTGTVSGQTKWAVAKSALQTVLSTYQTSIDFGLLLFPYPSQCGTGQVTVTIGSSNASAIMAQLATAPPTAGNYTPMYQSLDVAGADTSLQDKTYGNSIILITDGWQWCDPYDSSTRFLPVTSAATIAAASINLYVVGFGDSVDALTLNKMADAAGTKIDASCNPASSNYLATNNCYYQANNPTDLLAALKKIALAITAEKCDGVDNDCNGLVDDGLTQSCSTACGSGFETCTAGTWGGCTATQPTTEVCDGVDNDCDGTIDEGCSCVNGKTRACGVNKGECKQGTQTCSSGTWSTCTGGVSATTEICDGKDNDCDGKIDEDLTRACTTKCGSGTEKCVSGSWTGCTAKKPTTEICDGIDNDCDGTVDGPNAKCASGGICKGGICVQQDAGVPEDAGTPPPVMDEGGEKGCDCSVGAPRSGSALGLLGLLALLGACAALLRRTRR